MIKFLLLVSALAFLQQVDAQSTLLKGSLKDTSENSNLSNAVITLTRESDSTLFQFTRADAKGAFEFKAVPQGKYVMLITYPAFADLAEDIDIKDAEQNIGVLALTRKSQLLKEVIVRTGAAIRIKGDTTEFTADSFAVKEGATVEDLMKKLPGFQVNSKGEITTQGKRVEKVLVDGEEFFGDDPTMATQNLSAKIVDKVQVFNTKTEQQNLSGISTGSEGKTVNIKLKENGKRGAFGKAIAGSDFDRIIDAKALYNRFINKKKLAFYATASDVNTGSLNWEDRQKLGMENDMDYDEISGYYYSFGSNDEFNDWSLRGLPHAYTAGGLFSNKWDGDKQNVNTSYRYNLLNTDNDQSSLTQSTFPFITNTARFTKSRGSNAQHAVTGKYEWKIDSLASLKLTTSFTYKNTGLKGNTLSDYEYLEPAGDKNSYSSTQYMQNDLERMQNENSLVYKQLFKKKNRQLLTTLRHGITEDNQLSYLLATTNYFTNGVLDSVQSLDQMKDFDGHSKTIGGKVTFSEPFSAKWNLVLDYAHNRNKATSYRNSFNKDGFGKYGVRDLAFSNNFDMTALSHSSTATMRYLDKKWRMAFGSGVSSVGLRLFNLDSNRRNNYNFLNLTPSANFSYSLKQQSSLSFNYRGTTRQPSLDQLQPIRNNNDPLYEVIGNPNLKVAFTHGLGLNYNNYKVLSGASMYVSLNYGFTNNAITNYNIVDRSGKRTSTPVNVDGNYNWNLWSYWSKGGGEKKLNYGVQLEASDARYNSFVNTELNQTDYKRAEGSISMTYNHPEKYSFELRPELGYSTSKTSTTSRTVGNNYYTYGGYANGFVMLPGKLELSSDINFDLQQKIEGFGGQSNIILWNANLARKVFKKKTGKIIFAANDILDQNRGFTRRINTNFIQEERYSRISRYFLLKFEWSFNKQPGS